MEMLHEDGLVQFEMEHVSDTSASKIYSLAKSLYQDQLLELFYHPVLIPELLSLEAEKRSKQKIIVRGQMKKGAHDDISDAYIRAVWACYQDSKDKNPNLTTSRGGAVRKPTMIKGAGSLNTFALNKEKLHGAHPRLGSVNRRNRYICSDLGKTDDQDGSGEYQSGEYVDKADAGSYRFRNNPDRNTWYEPRDRCGGDGLQ